MDGTKDEKTEIVISTARKVYAVVSEVDSGTALIALRIAGNLLDYQRSEALEALTT